MVFLACGINHKTAPITIREKVSVSDEQHNQSLLKKLLATSHVTEAALLSTCNRTELYCDASDAQLISAWFAKEHGLSEVEVTNSFYHYHENEGVKHAMRVACGLDSMMLGEPQILGQMKNAYRIAESIGSIGATLRPIFHHVFSASKRIRTHTGIGVSPVSIAYASVNLVKQIFNDNIPKLSVFLIGSGETSQLVAKYLKQAGVSTFYVASRTLNNAKKLAQSIGGQPLSIGDIPQFLPDSDIVISATACPLPFISHGLIQKAMQFREGKPMFLLDLAVPRDIEQEVHEINNVHLYNIDDLQHLVDEGLTERQTAASHAEQIIDYELEEYIRWHRTLKATATLKRYRKRMNTIAEQELTRITRRLRSNAVNPEEALAELKYRLVNKLAHKPTVGLKRAARDNRDDLLSLVSYLFNE